MNKDDLELALREAMDWKENLTERQHSIIPYAEAKEERLNEILEKTWKLTEL